MDWQDLYVPTFIEQYDYAPMADLWTTTLHEANYCMIRLFQTGMFTYNPYNPLGPKWQCMIYEVLYYLLRDLG